MLDPIHTKGSTFPPITAFSLTMSDSSIYSFSQPLFYTYYVPSTVLGHFEYANTNKTT